MKVVVNFYVVETEKSVEYFTNLDDVCRFVDMNIDAKKLEKESFLRGFDWTIKALIVKGFNNENWYVEK